MQTTQIDAVSTPTSPTDLSALLAELDHYREQSARLRKVNELYARLAGIMDLPSMIEIYSIWLSQFVDHDLIAYWNETQDRLHMFCSCHGPKRRQIIDTARTLLEQRQPIAALVDGYHAFSWSFAGAEEKGCILILRQGGPFHAEARELIQESIAILSDPLRRAVSYEEIYQQAHRDALTGLPNRFVFEERVVPLMEHAQRYGHPLTVAILDLDHFKEINDNLGHLRGDQVLKTVARTLAAQIRATDLLVRMGGDEFLLVLPETELQQAAALAARLCSAVSELRVSTGVDGHLLGVSIGLAQWRAGQSVQAWLEEADNHLYQAKAGGRNQVFSRAGGPPQP